MSVQMQSRNERQRFFLDSLDKIVELQKRIWRFGENQIVFDGRKQTLVQIVERRTRLVVVDNVIQLVTKQPLFVANVFDEFQNDVVSDLFAFQSCQ